jgi:hypothetical protein
VTVEVLKISLGLYFLRIFHERWQRWTIYYMLALITVISTVYFFLIIFQCGTPKGAFEHMASQGTQGKCLNHVVIYGFGYAHNTINSLADVLFVLLGLYVIHSSLIRKRDQVIVGFILCLGVMYDLPHSPHTALIERLADHFGRTGEVSRHLSASDISICWEASAQSSSVSTAPFNSALQNLPADIYHLFALQKTPKTSVCGAASSAAWASPPYVSPLSALYSAVASRSCPGADPASTPPPTKPTKQARRHATEHRIWPWCMIGWEGIRSILQQTGRFNWRSGRSARPSPRGLGTFTLNDREIKMSEKNE